MTVVSFGANSDISMRVKFVPKFDEKKPEVYFQFEKKKIVANFGWDKSVWDWLVSDKTRGKLSKLT